MPVEIHSLTFNSPVGNLLAQASEKGLTKIHFIKTKIFEEHRYTKNQTLIKARDQLLEYFEGKRKKFDLPYDFLDASEFYKSVWKILLTIPYGQTLSYGDIARKMGDINKSRAIGLANGRNPIAIIIPCHRVIGSNGSLTGYGGGLDIKLQLLQLENPGKWVEQVSLF